MRHTHDTIIIGGGLVGMTTALALAASGIRSAVIDSADLDATLAAGFDGRALQRRYPALRHDRRRFACYPARHDPS